jgi:flagellar protein FliL
MMAATIAAPRADKADKADKDAASAEVPAKKKGKKKKLIILVVLVVVLGAGAKFGLGGSKKADGATAAPKPGPIVALDAVTVNLSGGHYLRIGIAVEFTSKVSATAPPDGVVATDQTIVYFTGQDPTPLQTPAGLAAAKKGLEDKLTAAYPDDPIYDVLFTSFVVQ